MKRSLRQKLIALLTTLISVALLLGGSLLIWQNVQDMRRDIFLDALTFAELTHDKIVTSFEQFYLTENFLQFRKEVNPLLTQSMDIDQIEVIGKSQELFYHSEAESEVAYIGEARKHDYELDRSRDIKPSLLFRDGSVIYVKKNAQNEWLPVDQNERLLAFENKEVVNIIFPHQNARLGVAYRLNYDALWSRISQMALGVIAVILLSVLVVSLAAIYFAGRLVKPLKILEKGVVQIEEGAYGTQVEVESQDEIGVLADTFNRMSKRLKKNTKELLEKEKITKELDIAKSIQENMLPDTDPKVKGLDISGSLTPATQIGGDIYDYLNHRDGGSYIFIADVTGHGVPAGMVANITHSTLYSFSQVYAQTHEIMQSMNQIIHAKTNPNMFATALLAYWDVNKRQLSYCNAGHEQIVHYRAQEQKAELVGKGGMALGMVPDAQKILKEEVLETAPGDVLVLYTDGIPEAWQSKKKNLGMEAFVRIVEEAVQQEKNAEGIRSSILSGVTAFRQGYPQQDDITLVVLRVKRA